MAESESGHVGNGRCLMSIFTSYTTRVTDEKSFLGRQNHIARAEEWLFPLSPDEFPSFSICGLTRMGKTSLALQLLERVKKIRGANSVIYADATKWFPEGRNSARFWNKLRAEVQKKVAPLTQSDDADDAMVAYDKFEDILRCSTDRKIICIDEFDKCLHLSDLSDFLNILRALINGSYEYKVQFVLVSRRSPELIQSKTDGSTLPGTLQRIDLKPFSREEFKLLTALFREEGYALSEEEAHEIWELTGGHPYLSNAILSEVRNITQSDGNRIDLAYSRVSPIFESYYQELLDFFDEFPVEKRFQTEVVSSWRDCLFFERLYGRMIPPETKTHLKRYGLSGEESVVPAVFDTFLRQAISALTNWEEICRLEKNVRDFIDTSLRKYYGNGNWFDCLDIHFTDIWEWNESKKADAFKNTICRWFEKDRRRNPGLRNRPIDFCYFDDLAGLICMEQHWNPDKDKKWKGFSTLFHGSKDECRKLLEAVGAIRNPEAHSRDYPKDFQIRFIDARDKLNCIFEKSLFDS